MKMISDFISCSGKKYEDGFAVKAHFGSEAMDRPFDENAWKVLGNSPELKGIYEGEDLRSIIKNILCRDGLTLCPLPEQTWIRLMSHHGATKEHAVWIERDFGSSSGCVWVSGWVGG